MSFIAGFLGPVNPVTIAVLPVAAPPIGYAIGRLASGGSPIGGVVGAVASYALVGMIPTVRAGIAVKTYTGDLARWVVGENFGKGVTFASVAAGTGLMVFSNNTVVGAIGAWMAVPPVGRLVLRKTTPAISLGGLEDWIPVYHSQGGREKNE